MRNSIDGLAIPLLRALPSRDRDSTQLFVARLQGERDNQRSEEAAVPCRPAPNKTCALSLQSNAERRLEVAMDGFRTQPVKSQKIQGRLEITRAETIH